VSPLTAKTLETDFFRAQVPEHWDVSRDTSGLWVLLLPVEDSQVKATLLVNRLRTAPELYLQATARLWTTKGTVEVLEEAGNAQEKTMIFLIRPKLEDKEPVLKFVQWQEDLMVITSFTFPVKHLAEILEEGQRFTGNIELKEFDFQPERLKSLISETLDRHQNSLEELSDPTAVRIEMASFRQDWEPYFPHHKPLLYLAFLAYLEARFDAAFAKVNGPGLGMPPDLIEARMTSISNRREELLSRLEADFDPDEGPKDSL
jgi:hypothetical protein